MPSKQSLLTGLKAALLVAALAGCGGGNDSVSSAGSVTTAPNVVSSQGTGASSGSPSGNSTGASSSAAASGSFISQIMALFGRNADREEPVPLDGKSLEKVNDREAQPLS